MSAADIVASGLAYADSMATVTQKHREQAAKVIGALELAGYGVLTPREIMLNAANALELKKLRDQRHAIREFLGLPVDGLTYAPSPSAYDEPDDLGYSGLDRSFDDHAGWQGGGL